MEGDDWLTLYGGRDANNVFGDLWVVAAGHLETGEHPPWATPRIVSAQPEKRAYHAAFEWQNRLYIHGGKTLTNSFFEDMYYCEIWRCPETQHILASWTRVEQLGVATKRAYHAAAVHPATESVFVYGGHDGQRWVDTLSQFDLRNNTWSHIVVNNFMPRLPARQQMHCGCAACFHAQNVCEVCYTPLHCCTHGSPTLQGPMLANRLASLKLPAESATNFYKASEDMESSAQAYPYPIPARDAHSMTLLGQQLYLFGGEVAKTFFDTLLEIDLGDGKQSGWKTARWSVAAGTAEVAPQGTLGSPHVVPGHRAYHNSWALNSWSMLSFGGYCFPENRFYDDLWLYDRTRNSWALVDTCLADAPRPSKRASAAVCNVDGVAYVFGGDDGEQYFHELWELTLENNAVPTDFAVRPLLKHFAGQLLASAPVSPSL
jgi:hypothetical protein